MRTLNFAAAAVLIVLGVCLAAFSFHMLVNCVYVPDGQSLQLRYKGPLLFGSGKPAQPGQFAKYDEGEVGVLEEMRGPGRHFYCPIWWERKLVDDVVVSPGEVAIVTSRMGDSLPAGQFLVDGGISGADHAKHKGILRKAFGPGRYRVNPYAYEFTPVKTEQLKVGDNVKHSGWVSIPTGYVGVVTELAGDPARKKVAGIQANVLPPGLYAVNPRAQQIDIVGIGFWETSLAVDHVMGPDGKEKLDASGEPEAVAESGIAFPSNDGFNIQLDFTAIWGVLPKDAPELVRIFGNVNAAETSVSDHFHEVLKDKHISLLYGLIRHIYIPKDIRQPLQEGYIADEMKLTREEERTTKMAEGELREAEKKVLQEAEKVKVETAKLVAAELAEGQKQVGEIEAMTKQQVAVIDRQIAEFDAKKTEELGKAEADAERMKQEATSQKFDLAVKAFGDAGSYTRWQFAEELPTDIQLQLFYAGEGTLWTDLKGITPTLPLTPPTAPAGTKATTRPAAGTPASPASGPRSSR
jgi:hypothetical protein